MNKKYIIYGIIAFVVLLLFVGGCNSYNGLVSQEENVNNAWAQVENQYQRRADLIPNLVNTVKGYAAHESQTLQAVIDARAKATSITIDPTNLDEATLEQYQQAQGELSSALNRLMAISEAYPDLKANQNFRDLQVQLEGTENRITTERGRYTEAVKEYNLKVRRFPGSIFAGLFGFDTKPQFKAEAGANQAPDVQF